MRLLQWTVAARRDLLDDLLYYRRIDDALASRLFETVVDRCRWLTDHPTAGSPLGRSARKYSVRGTPFIIIYRTRKDDIEILRIRHHAEDWRPR